MQNVRPNRRRKKKCVNEVIFSSFFDTAFFIKEDFDTTKTSDYQRVSNLLLNDHFGFQFRSLLIGLKLSGIWRALVVLHCFGRVSATICNSCNIITKRYEYVAVLLSTLCKAKSIQLNILRVTSFFIGWDICLKIQHTPEADTADTDTGHCIRYTSPSCLSGAFCRASAIQFNKLFI